MSRITRPLAFRASCLLTLASLVSFASPGAPVSVSRVATAPVVDGRLDDACWREATWRGGFHRYPHAKDRTLRDKAEYAVATDGSSLFFAIRCHCTDMAKVKARGKGSMWCSDTVEFFFAPGGTPDEFYHFAADYQGGRTFCEFCGEAGVTRPDPYAPDWRMKVGDTADGWCAEASIPFSGLYMTRNSLWSPTWLFNVGFDNHTMGECSVPTDATRLSDCKRFAPMTGFPKRAEADDFAATGVLAAFDSVVGAEIRGEMTMAVETAVGGAHELSSPFVPKTTLDLKPGRNDIRVRCAFPARGRHLAELTFVRKGDGRVFRRTYPVRVFFEPLVVKFTKPGFRTNFYPGQDVSQVAGAVRSCEESPVSLVLEGPGFPRRTATLPKGGGAFAFDTKGFRTGDARLTVTAGARTKTVKIRNLPPTGHAMAWVENHRLIVDGHPVFKRDISAVGYMGGAAFKERFDSTDLSFPKYTTANVCMEIARLVKGIEQREAVRDVYPSDDILRKIDGVIEANRNRDFATYEICDEPECRAISPVYLRHIYDYVTERDPYHVIRVASRAAGEYFFMCDLGESHDYVSIYVDSDGRRQWGVTPAMIADRMDAHASKQTPDKVLGCYSTGFAYRWNSYRNDYPQFDEYLASTFAGIVNGAKSLKTYAYHDLGDRPSVWYGCQYAHSTVKALEDFLLADGETLVRSKDGQCVRFAANGEQCFVAVNYTRAPLRLDVPQLKGTRWLEFRGPRTFADGVLDLEPYRVLIGTTAKRDAGLATYGETAALVARKEYERTHRDNQLLGREADIVFETPGIRRFVDASYKFVDGTRDVMGGYFLGTTNATVKMTFRNGLRPAFDRVTVWGTHTEGLAVDVCEKGAWRTLPAASRESARWSTTVRLAAPVAAEAMRVRLPTDKNTRGQIEIYEIELPAP